MPRIVHPMAMTRPLPPRRAFLRGIAATFAFVAGCGRQSGGDSQLTTSAATSHALTEGEPLPMLDTLANASSDVSQFTASLVAEREDVAIVPGASTSMLRYNGRSPGPLIELAEGQHVRIELENRLDDSTTIHWHGLPVPPDQDGNPMDPVAAGTTRIYEFDVPRGTAGTYWYHPHPHDATASQVARGLAAPLIVRADDDPLAGIPEVLMFITGLKLDAQSQVAPDTPIDWTVGRQQEMLLVNGRRLPVHAVAPGATQRWRIFNATAASHLRLALEGHTFTLVGTDGGLLGAPVAGLAEFLLAPAQRAELIVRANGAPHGRYRLRALRFETDFLNLGTYQDQDLLTLATTNALPTPPVELPPVLRPIEDLGPPTAQQSVSLDEVADVCTSNGAKRTFLINNRLFDMNRVDLVTEVGRVELWNVVNNTAMAHPFHIHGTQFQLVSRQVGTDVTPSPYLAWLDTVLVPSQQAVTIKARQTLPGKRMFHCHILEHEDNCMMAILDVRPANGA
jgi:suppressor of ftsI